MLIDFSVANFRSFRERQTFSMVAAPRLGKKQNFFIPELIGETAPHLLKLATIYGPNASGKSNLVRAMEVIPSIARRKPSAQQSPLPVIPFRFDPQLAKQPTEIEINFITAKERYRFSLSATRERILKEQLVAFPKGREQILYERTYSQERDVYEFSSKLEGGPTVHETWKKLTGPQTLFIAQAVANSSEEFVQLRKPFAWLQRGMIVISEDLKDWAQALRAVPKNMRSPVEENIPAFLDDIDIPVSKIAFTDNDTNREDDLLKQALEGGDDTLKEVRSAVDNTKITLTHNTTLGEAEFDFSEESDGTKALLGFWIPWSGLGIDSGVMRTLVIDELDSSIHPVIVATLVDRHLTQHGTTQLIFTTHDTHLMEVKKLRRDQFWLTERDSAGATQLRSIHDFVGRESEDIEKRYFEGRYRSLPIIRKS